MIDVAMAAPRADNGRRVAVEALLWRDGHLLLGRRASHRRSFPERWDVIGGHVEAGESPSMALSREWSEEIGIVPLDARPLASLSVDDDMGGRLRLHLFVVTIWAGSIALCGDEHDALRWFTPVEAAGLQSLALDGYRDIVRRLLATID